MQKNSTSVEVEFFAFRGKIKERGCAEFERKEIFETMKKIVAWMLVLVLAFALVGCTRGGNLEGEATENGGVDNTEGGLENENGTEEKQGLGARLVDDFKTLLNANNMMGGRALVDELLKSDRLSFESKVTDVQPGKLTGFKAEITGFKEGVMFAPTKGDIPFIGYVFTLEDDTDVESFVAMLKKNADVEWNETAKADEMMAEGLGKMVFFVMTPKSLDKE